jgi:hypothetical protein
MHRAGPPKELWASREEQRTAPPKMARVAAARHIWTSIDKALEPVKSITTIAVGRRFSRPARSLAMHGGILRPGRSGTIASMSCGCSRTYFVIARGTPCMKPRRDRAGRAAFHDGIGSNTVGVSQRGVVGMTSTARKAAIEIVCAARGAPGNDSVSASGEPIFVLNHLSSDAAGERPSCRRQRSKRCVRAAACLCCQRGDASFEGRLACPVKGALLHL